MAKKKKEIEEVKDFDVTKYDQHMKSQETTEMLDFNYMPYAMSVIISRALPDVRDGCKPAQRKTLYTMKNMNLTPGHKSKSANIAGTTLRLNPHSDQSCYETMVRLTDKNETLLAPYVAGKGSFGKHYSRDMAFAASRYCVTGDTLVLTDAGSIKIEDIYKSANNEDIDINIKSFKGITNHSSKVFDSGIHDTYKITLKNGLEITCTSNHPLLTIDKNGIIDWKLVEQLEAGDICVINADSKNTLFGSHDDLLEAKMLGSMISEDYVTTQNRNIPNIVWSGTKQYQATFLKYLFEGDGSVRNEEKNKEISYSTYSETLAKEIILMLAQSFGIVSYIAYSKTKPEMKIIISGFNVDIFRKEIGFVSKRKNEILNSIEIKRTASNSFECCTELANRIKEEFNTTTSYNCKFMATRFLEEQGDEYFYNILNTCAFVPVKSKEYAGQQRVYSIKVDSECHSFVANGFINHNTEASLSTLGMELFKGINKNAVDMVDNYDGTMKEPSVLPVAFPAILANPTLGIAVGFASNICSFNMKELCEATIEKIKHPKSDLLDIMPAPDFSTGGVILYDKETMRDIYNTGRGSIKIRASYEIDKKNNRIEIKEIPYSTTAEAIVESVIALCKSGKIKEINDIRDDTDKNGLTLTIEYKRTCDPEQLMLKLFKLTPLEDTFACNFNVIVDGNPKCLGVYAILDEWIKFRKECILRMLNFDKADLEHKLHLLRGLEKILLNVDKAIKIIKNTEKDEDVVPNLMSAFKIDEEQATYIADMKLRNINKEYILSRTVVINDLVSQIEKLNKQIGSEAEIKKIAIADLQAIIKKFGIERKSKVVDINTVEQMADEDPVMKYDLKLYITDHGYIKKIAAKSISDTTEIKTKDEDTIKFTFDDDNLSDLLIFTNKTNVYKVKVSDIPDCKPSDFGSFLNTVASMDEDEEIVYVICTKDYSGNVLISFENGKVAKFPINVYETKTNRKMLKNGFFGGSKPVFFDTVTDNEDSFYILVDSKKRRLLFSDKDVPLKNTKTTQGVQIIRLSKGLSLVECNPVKVTNKKSLEKLIPNNYPAAGR